MIQGWWKREVGVLVPCITARHVVLPFTTQNTYVHYFGHLSMVLRTVLWPPDAVELARKCAQRMDVGDLVRTHRRQLGRI